MRSDIVGQQWLNVPPPPPNLDPHNEYRFELDDAKENWTFPEKRCNFIHTSMLYSSISDWNR